MTPTNAATDSIANLSAIEVRHHSAHLSRLAGTEVVAADVPMLVRGHLKVIDDLITETTAERDIAIVNANDAWCAFEWDKAIDEYKTVTKQKSDPEGSWQYADECRRVALNKRTKLIDLYTEYQVLSSACARLTTSIRRLYKYKLFMKIYVTVSALTVLGLAVSLVVVS